MNSFDHVYHTQDDSFSTGEFVLEHVLKAYSFSYQGEPAVAIRITQRPIAEETMCFITSPETLTMFYTSHACAPFHWNKKAKAVLQNYRIQSKAETVYSGRLIAGCSHRHTVEHKDTNRLNLLPSNLKVVEKDRLSTAPGDVLKRYLNQAGVHRSRYTLLGFLVNPKLLDTSNPFKFETSKVKHH